jgi:hypothetical protein
MYAVECTDGDRKGELKEMEDGKKQVASGRATEGHLWERRAVKACEVGESALAAGLSCAFSVKYLE